MSLLSRLIAFLLERTAEELLELEEAIMERAHRCRFHATTGRFSGPFYVNPAGEFILATFKLTPGVQFTGALVFVDASGATGPGPIGTVTSSDPSVSIGLSADGQAYNILMTTADVTATMTWSDPSGVIPSFSADFADVVTPPVFVPVSGSFGAPSEGTTP